MRLRALAPRAELTPSHPKPNQPPVPRLVSTKAVASPPAPTPSAPAPNPARVPQPAPEPVADPSQVMGPRQVLEAAGPRSIDKYMWLRRLRVSSPHDYHGLMRNYITDVLPYIYTPTVGQACQEYHALGIATRGLYITLNDRGNILNKLKSWPNQDVRVIVVTDGERILGLGDLGANGMGISEGKIELYTAAAGVNPEQCLPICIDVGTNNLKLRDDPEYKGLRHPRPGKEEYMAFMAEFMKALKDWQPHLLIQFEDFGNTNAFTLLEKYQVSHCCFNDDIQGTAAITLAAVLTALRVTGSKLGDQRVLFLGAGEAAAGIATLIAYCIHRREGVPEDEARQRCFLLDSKGLVCASRTDLQHHKVPFAHDVSYQPNLKAAIKALKPTAIVGVAAQGGAFDQEVVELMSGINERPIIFALSNPTSLAECTFRQCYDWSKGKAIFASGSPFDDIFDAEGKVHHPSQANNAYIFPGIGHAAILTRAVSIPEEVFLVAAEQLSKMASPEEIEEGRLFPPFDNIFNISAHVMARTAEHLVAEQLGRRPAGWGSPDKDDWVQRSRDAMWRPLPTPLTTPLSTQDELLVGPMDLPMPKL